MDEPKRCGEAGPLMKRFMLADGSEIILPADAILLPPYKEGDPVGDADLGGCFY